MDTPRSSLLLVQDSSAGYRLTGRRSSVESDLYRTPLALLDEGLVADAARGVGRLAGKALLGLGSLAARGVAAAAKGAAKHGYKFAKSRLTAAGRQKRQIKKAKRDLKLAKIQSQLKKYQSALGTAPGQPAQPGAQPNVPAAAPQAQAARPKGPGLLSRGMSAAKSFIGQKMKERQARKMGAAQGIGPSMFQARPTGGEELAKKAAGGPDAGLNRARLKLLSRGTRVPGADAGVEAERERAQQARGAALAGGGPQAPNPDGIKAGIEKAAADRRAKMAGIAKAGRAAISPGVAAHKSKQSPAINQKAMRKAAARDELAKRKKAGAPAPDNLRPAPADAGAGEGRKKKLELVKAGKAIGGAFAGAFGGGASPTPTSEPVEPSQAPEAPQASSGASAPEAAKPEAPKQPAPQEQPKSKQPVQPQSAPGAQPAEKPKRKRAQKAQAAAQPAEKAAAVAALGPPTGPIDAAAKKQATAQAKASGGGDKKDGSHHASSFAGSVPVDQPTPAGHTSVKRPDGTKDLYKNDSKKPGGPRGPAPQEGGGSGAKQMFDDLVQNYGNLESIFERVKWMANLLPD